MTFQKGTWIMDQHNKKPIWITALGLDDRLLMGWGVHNHNAVWCVCSTKRDMPRTLTETEIESFITSELDVDGYTSVKVIFQNPDDYLFKNITKYGIEDTTLVTYEIAKAERIFQNAPLVNPVL